MAAINFPQKAPQNNDAIYGEICDQCRKLGGEAPRLFIPLQIHDDSSDDVNRQAFLCMCRFDTSSIGLEKPHLYKASLLQTILSINLTNAKLHHGCQKARHDSVVDPLIGVGTPPRT